MAGASTTPTAGAGPEFSTGTSRGAGQPDPNSGWTGSSAGLRQIIIGAIVAVLAPLGGFLGGSMVDSNSVRSFDPLFVWLFAGLVIGGIAAIVAILGALRWLKANRFGAGADSRR